jgi:hypothetical protein
MNKLCLAFTVGSVMAAMSAILLGRTAGLFYNLGSNPAGTKFFALAILCCFAAGCCAFGALRSRNAPAKPVTPVENRKWCRLNW